MARARRVASATTRDEAVRVLRSNLLVAVEDLRNPIVVVTSAQPGEGKTSIAVTLARSLALAGSRTVLVDLDLRRPGAHALLGVASGPGCADLLQGERTLDECLQLLAVPGSSSSAEPFSFLPAGTPTPNPTELLGGEAMTRLLAGLAGNADIVLLDTPPVLPVADTLVIGRRAAGAVLVVEAHRTPADVVQRAKSALTRNRTRLLGVVLNQLRPSDDEAAATFGYGDAGGA
jgi:succinoglycan biosynthesis transport protein ExoP